jgi:uncharacterized protein YndB with AHSA1/START domain
MARLRDRPPRGRPLALRHPRGRRLRVGFHGEYRAIAAPHRIVSTEIFEGYPDPDAASLNTTLFEEEAGVTTMTITVLHAKQEHRDAHIASGMEGGMQISMDRLENLVGELARAA